MKKDYLEPTVEMNVIAVEDIISTSQEPDWSTGERE